MAASRLTTPNAGRPTMVFWSCKCQMTSQATWISVRNQTR